MTNATLNINFTPRARDRLEAEGLASHTLTGVDWKEIPSRGDLMSFDWMLNGTPMLVSLREFMVGSDQSMSVTLWLDLVDDRPD